MTTRLATRCFIIGALLASVAAHAADLDKERAQATTFVKDAAITAKIKTKLADEKPSSLALIKVKTDRRGAVILSGKARTQEDADKAVAIARATAGVTSVSSSIQVKKEE